MTRKYTAGEELYDAMFHYLFERGFSYQESERWAEIFVEFADLWEEVEQGK